MKLLPIVENMMSEGLNLFYKSHTLYRYQERCYPKGDPREEIYDDDECWWAKGLQEALEKIRDQVQDDFFEIINISLFDKYQGPYATVRINGKTYKVWTMEYDELWIDGYPIDNTSDENNNPGFKGTWVDIVDVILELENFS